MHRSRGEGVESLGVLDAFEGVAVHDSWAFYNRYESAEHALCCAHILRELRAVTDADPEGQSWAAQVAQLLRGALAATDEAKAAGQESLAPAAPAAIEARYAEIVAAGHLQNPEPERTGKRGRPKRPTSLNLLRRLDSRRDEVLRFARDLRVPFDNYPEVRIIPRLGAGRRSSWTLKAQ